VQQADGHCTLYGLRPYWVIGLYSSVAERQSCKLKVLGSIPSGGFFAQLLVVCLSMASGLKRNIAMCEAREIRTPNLLIWSQTRCRCAIAPLIQPFPASIIGEA
jgi:hypothetical protein